MHKSNSELSGVKVAVLKSNPTTNDGIYTRLGLELQQALVMGGCLPLQTFFICRLSSETCGVCSEVTMPVSICAEKDKLAEFIAMTALQYKTDSLTHQ